MEIPEIARPMGKLEKQWMITYNELIKYDNNNNAIPSDSPRNKLGNWCSQQRKKYRNKKLSEKRIELLKKIPNWYWEKPDSFMISYKALEQYVIKHNQIPSQSLSNKEEKKLGVWCNSRRLDYRNGRLSERRIELLNKIPNWYWNKNDEDFMKNYNALKQYVIKHNQIPSQSSSNKKEFKLATWCCSRRCDRRKGNLSDKHVELLKKIPNWYWNQDTLLSRLCPPSFEESVASHDSVIFWDNENNGDIYPKDIYRGAGRICNLKCPTCSHSWKMRANRMAAEKFNGCPLCNGSISRGEREIMEAFDRLDRIGTPQHTYPGCFHKKPLHFDNAILNQLPIDILFEGDGRQHFMPVEWWGEEEGYNKRRICDIKKNKFCIENKLILLRISYTEKYESEKWIKLAIEKANRNEYGIIYSNPKLYETAYFHKIKTFIAIRTLQRRWRFKHYIPIKN